MYVRKLTVSIGGKSFNEFNVGGGDEKLEVSERVFHIGVVHMFIYWALDRT